MKMTESRRLSDAELRFAAENALANVMIEGFAPDEEFMTLWNRLLDGEISEEECHAIIIENARARERAALLRDVA